MASLSPPPIQTRFSDKNPTSGVAWAWLKWLQDLYTFVLGLGNTVAALPVPVTFVAVPATSTSAGTPNQVALDANFLYVCIAPNTWKRIALVSY